MCMTLELMLCSRRNFARGSANSRSKHFVCLLAMLLADGPTMDLQPFSIQITYIHSLCKRDFFLSNFGTADNVSTTYVTRAISSGLSIVQPKYWSVISPGLTMSPSVVRYVAPKVPTVLASRESVDLPGYDLWLHFVSFTQSLGSPSQSS